MKTLPTAPKYSTCWYCLNKVEGSHNAETEVQYTCRNHNSLIINWYCSRQTTNKWFFTRMIIALPNQFRLYWQIKFMSKKDDQTEDNNFYLHEYRKTFPNELSQQWFLFRDSISTIKSFPIDWVLTQTPERLQSLLEMYKVFS